jgi:pimeloyl-ACP methyl ester carboxylesterase
MGNRRSENVEQVGRGHGRHAGEGNATGVRGHDIDVADGGPPADSSGANASEVGTSRRRSVVKRVAVIVAVVALVTVVGLAIWLAPLVFDRDFPQTPEGATPLEPTGHVEVGDVELPYVEQGAGPPVLLIHGAGDGLRGFGALSDALAEDHRAISYSRRGYEGTGAPASAWELHHADAATILEELDADGAVVAGVSMGGPIAIELALEHPDLVSELVLVEPGMYVQDHGTLDALRVVLAVRIRGLFMPDERALIPFYRWILTHDDGHSPWDSSDFSDEARYRLVNSVPAVRADTENLEQAGEIPRERLGELTTPVTLLVGERTNPMFRDIAATLEQLIPNSQTVEIPDAGHGMIYEDPVGTGDAIRQVTHAAFEER